MKRTKKKAPRKVDAILTGDWHLREDVPECRTDDFITAQWNKVKEVRELQQKYNCPVYHSGDLFHHWKTSPALLSKCLTELPEQFYTVYGNHDVPQHNVNLSYKTGMNTLYVAGKIHLLSDGNWNQAPSQNSGIILTSGEIKRKIYVWHVYTYTGKAPFPGAEKNNDGHTLLDKYPQFDLILTGDNHIPFICKNNTGSLLINAGSLTRQTASQIDHTPAVYLYNAETNTVRAHYLKINPKAATRVHIDIKEERETRLSAFVERLGEHWNEDLDFESNVRIMAKQENISQQIMSICEKALDDETN